MSKGKFAIFGVVLTTLMVVVESDFTFTEEENIVISMRNQSIDESRYQWHHL